MATQFCQKCKQAHPGRVCDHNEKGECAETAAGDEVPEIRHPASTGEGNRQGTARKTKPSVAVKS